MEEIWKPIKGFEKRYKISNHGRIMSIGGKYGGEHILTLHIGGQGYFETKLCAMPKIRKARVHILVAEHFLNKPLTNKRIEIDHIDSNKLNNRTDNLRYLTASEHRRITKEKGEICRGSKHGNSKLKESDVLSLRELYKTGNYTHKTLGKMFGICTRQAGDVINRVNWSWL